MDNILDAIRQKRDALLAEAATYDKILMEFVPPVATNLREVVFNVLKDHPDH